MPYLFEAVSSDECDLCGFDIQPGEEVGYVDDRLCCAFCCEEEQ